MSDNGFNGVILRVNLTSGRVSTEELPSRNVEMFLGGRGLGAALLYREVDPRVDPLGPDNKLIFVTGPLTGTKVPGSSKYVVMTKSPLTNIYLMSLSSRDFGCQLKQAGYDALIVEGVAASPAYLYIRDGKVEIRDAGKAWGLTTDRADWYLHEELRDEQAKIACIGPAGENQVLYASIMNEWRAAGRGGAGAVMGAKRLKAIAVHGSGQVRVACQARFAEAIKQASQALAQSPRTRTYRQYGTVESISTNNRLGILPVDNWRAAYWSEADKISGDVMRESYLVKSTFCAPCVAHCSKLTLVREGPYAGILTEGPEYETLYSFGSCCGVANFDAVVAADALCDQYGMDSMSAGVTLAFATECYERGLLTDAETGGVQLAFGSHRHLREILHRVAYRQGLGELLALGTKRMAERIGRRSDAFAMHAKGMEMGGYDPRAVKGMATVYACGPRGGCHHAGGRTLPAELDSSKYDRLADRGKGELTKNARETRVVLDSAIICSFSSPGLEHLARLVSAATGCEYSPGDLMVLGDRVSNLERAYNVRAGVTRAADTLPRRLREETPAGGPASPVNLDLMLDEFYAACGWDPKTGIPTLEKLRELGLESIWKDVKPSE